MIYGVAVLAACTIAGKIIGNLFGVLVGTNSDIGGVGFGMILMLLVTGSKWIKKYETAEFSGAILFWQKMFIPIVIAMTASQNVFQAFSSGIVAIVAGFVPVLVAFILLPVISKITGGGNEEDTEHV